MCIVINPKCSNGITYQSYSQFTEAEDIQDAVTEDKRRMGCRMTWMKKIIDKERGSFITPGLMGNGRPTSMYGCAWQSTVCV